MKKGVKNMPTWLVFTLVVGVLVLLSVVAKMVANDNAGKHKGVAYTPSISVSAVQLKADYDQNEVSADQKYKGRRILVNGKIVNIGKDMLDNAYVVLSNGDANDVFNVRCMFEDENVMVSFRKGQYLKVIGTVEGKIGDVILKKCRLQ